MATVARSYNGDPEFGPDIYIEKSNSTKPRVLLGWRHTEDTTLGLKEGKIWCWVSEGNHFQVFDENFNRSKVPGEVRFCGVANFTMVRMFHPYWLKNAQVPRDMVSEDKRECRRKYKELLRRRPQAPPSNPDDSDDSDDSNDSDGTDPRPPPRRPLPGSSRPSRDGNRSTLSTEPRNAIRAGRERSVGFNEDSPFFISDSDSDSDLNSDVDGDDSKVKVDTETLHSVPGIITGLTGENAGLNNADTIRPTIKNEYYYDLTNSQRPSLIRSSITQERSIFKTSPGPAFSTELLRNLSKVNRTGQNNISLNQQPSTSSLVNDHITSDYAILPTIESDEIEIKEEETNMASRRRNRTTTAKPIVIVLDDSD